MAKVLGMGNALVDILTTLEDDALLNKFNLPKGSMQLVNHEISTLVNEGTSHLKKQIASGGSAANTIHGLAKLGIETGFIGKVGKDDFEDFFDQTSNKVILRLFFWKVTLQREKQWLSSVLIQKGHLPLTWERQSK